jgi:hypothetical protein
LCKKLTNGFRRMRKVTRWARRICSIFISKRQNKENTKNNKQEKMHREITKQMKNWRSNSKNGNVELLISMTSKPMTISLKTDITNTKRRGVTQTLKTTFRIQTHNRVHQQIVTRTNRHMSSLETVKMFNSPLVSTTNKKQKSKRV